MIRARILALATCVIHPWHRFTSFYSFGSGFVLLFLLVIISLAVACRHPSREEPTASKQRERAKRAKRLSDQERRAISSQFRAVIEHGGGPGVWVKNTGSAGLRSPLGDAVIEVLAASPAFEAVVAAIRRQSAEDGLQTRINEIGSPSRRRSLEIGILSGNEPVCQWRVYEVQQIRRAAIIIDDLGQNLDAARRLLHLPYPLTFSILPHLPQSVETAEEAHHAGRDVMLHLPMEPEPGSAARVGQETVRIGMTSGEVRRIIEDGLASVPYVVGVNNHMGSRATADATLMAEVMRILVERQLYFVDSRTTPRTVALEEARRMGLPAFYRSVFLDDTETVASTTGQLRRFRRIVEEQGVALAIGHPYPSTLAALAHFLPELERHDIQLVPASQLVRLPEVARLSPAQVRTTRNAAGSGR